MSHLVYGEVVHVSYPFQTSRGSTGYRLLLDTDQVVFVYDVRLTTLPDCGFKVGVLYKMMTVAPVETGKPCSLQGVCFWEIRRENE